VEPETFQIKTDAFVGPFSLLLHLVEKRKLFVNDVSLSQVTEEYLEYINKLGEFKPEEVSNFLVVASTLILIKSKSLLPNLELTLEEEGDIKSLEERLRLYEIYSKLAPNVKATFGRKMIFQPLERKNEVLIFLPDERITKESMMTFAKDALGNIPKKVVLPKVEVRKVISIEEMITNLTERIQNAVKTSFRDMHGKVVSREEKVVVIVGFLAMLELVRQGIIDAVQEENHGDIIMERQEIVTQETNI
jgi:segregation and condensation protein A